MDEKFEDLVLECSNCRLKFYASQLRTHPETNVLVCINCFRLPGSRIKIIKDRPLKKSAFKQAPAITAIKKDAEELLTSFECTYCRYQFNKKRGWKGSCPYCNRDTIRVKPKP